VQLGSKLIICHSAANFLFFRKHEGGF